MSTLDSFQTPGAIDVAKLLALVKPDVMGWVNQAVANAVLTGINIQANVDGQDIRPRSVLADIGNDTTTRAIVGVGTFDGNTQSQWVAWNRGASVGTGVGYLMGVGNPIKYVGGIRANLSDATAGVEDSIFRLRVMRDGALVEPFSLNVVDGWISLDWGLSLGGVLTPVQITSNQNDYSPTDIQTATTLRLSSDASRNITGLGNGGPGRILILENIGSNNVVLKDESADSTAAYRFALAADFTLAPDMAVMVKYDYTSSRWRIVGDGGGSSSGAAGKLIDKLYPTGYEPPVSNYATLDTRNNHVVLDFDGATDEEAVWKCYLPTHYAGGGLTVDLFVSFTSATSGTSRWQVSIERIDLSSLDTDADSFASAQSSGVSAPGASGQMVKCTVTFTNGAQMDSVAAGELFRLKVRRDADGTSGTDDITSDAELHAVIVRES